MFLVIIMGLTWIFGVLIVEVEELVPLAYIYTIMVAFQGLFIFLIFVVFSKKVREAYAKCWRAKVNGSAILSRYLGSSVVSVSMVSSVSVWFGLLDITMHVSVSSTSLVTMVVRHLCVMDSHAVVPHTLCSKVSL